MFLHLSVILLTGGVGHAWFLPGVHGCSGGACVVAPGGVHGCSWGGMHGCLGGCVVARGGVWLLPGACMVRGACLAKGGCVVEGTCMAKRRHVWQGGSCMVKGGHVGQKGACVAKGWGVRGRYTAGHCAGGTHPTGMHSCAIKYFNVPFRLLCSRSRRTRSRGGSRKPASTFLTTLICTRSPRARTATALEPVNDTVASKYSKTFSVLFLFESAHL